MEDHKPWSPGVNPLRVTCKQTQWLGSTHEKERGTLANSNADPVGHLLLAPILKVM